LLEGAAEVRQRLETAARRDLREREKQLIAGVRFFHAPMLKEK
jgi:hypothetical protein